MFLHIFIFQSWPILRGLGSKRMDSNQALLLSLEDPQLPKGKRKGIMSRDALEIAAKC